MPDNKGSTIKNITLLIKIQITNTYLKPTAACQTKANNKKKTGIIGKISTKGRNKI